jgi:hypothetical protein
MCRITLVRDLVDFHASGEGHRGHETLHHASVPELVLDGVGVVRASLFKKLFEVVCGWLRLTLAAACDHHGVLHVGATYLPIDATVVIGCSLLVTLLAPLLGRHFLDAAWGWVRLSHLVTDSVLSDGTTLFHGGVLEDADRFLKTL